MARNLKYLLFVTVWLYTLINIINFIVLINYCRKVQIVNKYSLDVFEILDILFEQFSVYLILFGLIRNKNELNNLTISLVNRIKKKAKIDTSGIVETGTSESVLCQSINNDIEDYQQKYSLQSGSPVYITIPRKAKLFKTLMERKLGIDLEHSFVSSSSELSLQTNEVLEGYEIFYTQYDN